MMMSFCKKSVHSALLALTNTNPKDNGAPPVNSSGATAGLGIFTVSVDIEKSAANVIQSAAVKSPPPPIKRDPGGIWFQDNVGGGGVDGLTSCTESLGFESFDERRVDNDVDDVIVKSNDKDNNSYSNIRRVKRTKDERRQTKKFPPPLSSLSQDGKPSFFLRSVRKDGRLELTQVKINRPETLLASRQDGRLRLHLVYNDQDIQNKSGEEEEEEGEEEEEKSVMEWKFPVTTNGGGADSSRRCYGHSFDHRHHDLHVWGPPCVSTR